MRRMLLLLLKVAVSILLLSLSLRSIDLAAVGNRLGSFQFSWIALAFLLSALQVVLLAIRWRRIAEACSAPFTLPLAVKIGFIAAFFNQVLPSTVGGDAVRIWLLARKTGVWAGATYSVLIDRVVGVFVLALMVIVCLPWTFELIRDPLARTGLVAIGGSALAGGFVFLTIGALRWRLFERLTAARHLREASRMALILCRAWPAASVVFLCSIVIHLTTMAIAWSCAKAVAAPVTFWDVLILMPPVLLISTIPISIAGWGVRESAMVAAFAFAGLAQSDGLTLSLLYGAVSFALGVVGGAVWITSGMRFAPSASLHPVGAIAEPAHD